MGEDITLICRSRKGYYTVLCHRTHIFFFSYSTNDTYNLYVKRCKEYNTKRIVAIARPRSRTHRSSESPSIYLLLRTLSPSSYSSSYNLILFFIFIIYYVVHVYNILSTYIKIVFFFSTIKVSVYYSIDKYKMCI